ncbi:MAG: CRTAC1 family protein, partial [bacterium]
TDWGLTVRLQDMDNDGDPDIYVCNDFASPDRIWINDGAGHFRAISRLAIRNTSSASMGIDFSDIDRDGDLDFFLAEMLSRKHKRRKTQEGPVSPIDNKIGEIDNRPQYMKNTLFLNRGDNTYAEIANYSGVVASEWSWTPLFLDVDLDGYEDLLIATGHYYDGMDVDSRLKLKTMSPKAYKQMGSSVFAYPPLALPDFIFRNRGDLTFEEVSESWGFASTDIAHGMAAGDLDNDGDIDIVMNRFNAAPGVYLNNSATPRVAVRLRGLAPNTRAIGSKIQFVGGPVPQSKEVISGGFYLSHSDQLYTFATGKPASELAIAVTWRNGKKSLVKGVKPNRIYEIYEPRDDTDSIARSDGISPRSQPGAENSAAKPIFEDASDLLNHEHHETAFADFKRQPLLPNRLSQLGPGLAWLDYDDDGDEDLFIGSGNGGKLAGFRNNGHGQFTPLRRSSLTSTTHHDQTTILGSLAENGESFLLVGFSNYEDDALDNSFIMKYEFKQGSITGKRKLLFNKTSLGPAALADYDGDGDLDLFAGGRTVPGRYPEPASSILYENKNGKFTPDAKNAAVLQDIGMVSGAVFSDIDNDADPDLILALEWGPITVLRNESGQFSNATEELGFTQYSGWWNGITTGDLNEDGRMDIIATNWGLNSKYTTAGEQALTLYFSDFDNSGTVDILEAYFDPELKTMVPQRSLASLRNAIPFVAYNTRTNSEFGEASLQDVIGPRLDQAVQLPAKTLANMVFLNLEHGFETRPMPAEAQFAPAFHVAVADFDGDGHDDVFLSQNFFATRTGTHRNDAGRALWLKGDGTGHLEAVPGQFSGIKVYGEQRGAAVADFDRDGRVDLAVTQNGATTKLYHNVGAKPGLRVRLAGPADNPSGVGCIIRLNYEDGYGPAREIHAGSGYWSQDSAVQILGMTEPARAIWVRWPDGKITQTDLAENTKEITVQYTGGLKSVDKPN